MGVCLDVEGCCEGFDVILVGILGLGRAGSCVWRTGSGFIRCDGGGLRVF